MGVDFVAADFFCSDDTFFPDPVVVESGNVFVGVGVNVFLALAEGGGAVCRVGKLAVKRENTSL